MGMPQLVVTAVLVEGRSRSEVAREYGVSRRWVITLIQRYLAEGDAGLQPRPRGPFRSPNRTAKDIEDEVIALRKELERDGHEAGAATIAFHLQRRHGVSPAVSTIWRILSARGFVTPQPAAAASRGRAPMTSTLRAEVAAAARIVGIVALFCPAAAPSLVASAAAVHAAPGTPVPNASHALGMYGDPSAAAPYWRQQHSSDCGELAVADVVGQITGHEPTEQQITALAESTPSTVGAGSIWNLPADTDNRDLPVLLAHYWIKADNIQTSINALEQDLAEKRRVIVLLNAETIRTGLASRTPQITSSLSPA
jgi:transposase